MDNYKVKILKQVLEELKQNEYYLCRLKGDNTNAINIEEDGIKLLIEYYSK